MQLEFDNPDQKIKSIQYGQLPEIISVTFNGMIQIYRMGENDEKLTDYAPKWLQPVVGASWAFGNKLAFFSEKNGGQVTEIHLTN